MLGETRRGLRVSPAGAWQLAAAVVAGVVLAKSLHWATEERASHSDEATRVAIAATAPVAPRGPRSVTVPRGEAASAISGTRSAALASPAAESLAAVSARSVSPESVSPESVSPESVSPGALASNVGARRARPCEADCVSLEHAAPNVSSRITAHAGYEESAVPPAEYGDDDWLGEQLALLSQAERSLLAGNPGGALRSVDEYRARFPRGLLDPQIGALRERAERSAESFIFP